MNIKKILTGFTAFAAIALFATTAYAVDSTVVVTGNTAAGENQPGWLFNRDLSTSTPYEFNNAQASIGIGSLYVKPIGANASDKFIGENFVNSPITNVNSISYDFRIGSGGDANDDEQFYMSVYANFGVSPDDKFYDCRYNVVPTVGSTAGFTTVTFDPTQAYPVTTRGGASASPFTCPAIPADMDILSAGSNIRMFALNVGDTSTSDVGLDGYLDKVVTNLDSGVTTYDFEPVPLASLSILTPAHNASIATSAFTMVDWTDATGGVGPYQYRYEAYSDPAYTTLIYNSGFTLATSQIATPGTPPGEYYLRVIAKDSLGTESAWSNGSTNPHHITVTADVTPTPIPNLPVACAGMTITNVITGTNRSEVLNGTSGNDFIYGVGGSDVINGAGGNDCILAANGSSVLNGGSGNDVIVAGNASDTVNGGADNDKIWGNGGSDYLAGGAGMDELYGGNGSDVLSGEADNDMLFGDGGSDLSLGGAGSDTCIAEVKTSCEL